MSQSTIMSASTHLALMKAGRARAERFSDIPTPTAMEFPCVRVFPSLSEDTALLVGFDSSKRPRIKIELLKADISEDWKTWILRYIRRREEQALKLIR